ncbi:MAG: diacylglycerol kinase family lipid kinase [Anaerolineales bacterium]
MKAKVILNPYAGRWLALERRQEVERVLRDHGIDFDLAITEGPNHGIELASLAVRDGYNPIIAAGGDGSISEVVNGMMEAEANSAQCSLGVLPLGSVNDFVHNLGLPTTLLAAVQVIAAGKTRLLDLGSVKVADVEKIRYFDNNAAVGLEPYVTLIQERMTRLRGRLRYLAATLLAIRDNPQWSMQLEWDGGSYQGPISLVTVGNSPLTGGVFYMTPHADPFDGKLTFVYGFIPTRWQILRILPRTMKPGSGSYVEHPVISEIHTSWLKIRSDRPTPAHADGEIISKSAQEIEYLVHPVKLPVLLP